MERFANRDVCDLTIVDFVSKKPIMYIDYANATSTELTGESVYAYGGHGHVKRVTFTGNREGTLTLETQVQTFELYQLVTGGTLSTASRFIKRELLTASATPDLTLSETPVTGSVNVFAENDDCGTALNLTVTGTAVTSGTGEGATTLVATNKYYAYYMVDSASGVQTISVSASSFPKNVTIYGSTNMTTEGGETRAYKLIAYKAQAQSNAQFGFQNDGDPQTLTITFDLMADTSNNDKILELIMDDEE